MDIFGDHAMSCKFTKDSINKHDSVVDILFYKLRAAGISANLNVGHASQSDNYYLSCVII